MTEGVKLIVAMAAAMAPFVLFWVLPEFNKHLTRDSSKSKKVLREQHMKEFK